MDNVLEVYDLGFNRLCILSDNTNATSHSITEVYKLNSIVQLSFTFPLDNPKSKYLINENLIKYKGEYYFIKTPKYSHSQDKKIVQINCDHESVALQGMTIQELPTKPEFNPEDPNATGTDTIGKTANELMTRVLVGTGWSVGNIDIPNTTKRSLQSSQQSVFTNLTTIAQLFNAQLKFDSYFKKVDLIGTPPDRNIVIRKGKNLQSIDLNYDTTGLVTRLYVFGGNDIETNSQINIMNVNPNGHSYIENYDYFLNQGYTIEYIRSRPDLFLREAYWTDQSYLDEVALYEDAVKRLEKISKPVISATIQGVDLSIFPEHFIKSPVVGEIVYVVDEDINCVFNAQVTDASFDSNNPLSLKVTLTNAYEYKSVVQNLTNSAQATNNTINPQNQINGSNIVNGSIDNLKVRDLSADKLTAGTIDAQIIDVINLKADNIKTGRINAEEIEVYNLDAGKIKSGTIDAQRIGANSLTIGKFDEETRGVINNSAQLGHNYNGTVIDTTNGITVTNSQLTSRVVLNATDLDNKIFRAQLGDGEGGWEDQISFDSSGNAIFKGRIEATEYSSIPPETITEGMIDATNVIFGTPDGYTNISNNGVKITNGQTAQVLINPNDINGNIFRLQGKSLSDSTYTDKMVLDSDGNLGFKDGAISWTSLDETTQKNLSAPVVTINGGVRNFTFDEFGVNLTTPIAYSISVTQGGITVVPFSITWSYGGFLSGTTSKPTVGAWTSNDTWVQAIVRINGVDYTQRIPISSSKIGDTGDIGPRGANGVNGIDGQDAITSILSNDSHVVPTDSIGNNGNYAGATTAISIFEGTTNVTSYWTISQSRTSGLTVTEATNSKTATVTNSTIDTGIITFTATRTGYPTQVKIFTITKAKGGVAGNSLEILYTRTISKPTTPIGDNPSGWTSSIPSGYGNAWYITGTKNSNGILQGTWSTPALVTQYNSNLLQSQVWSLGTGSDGNYLVNGTNSENVRSIGTTPTGALDIIWRAIDQDTANDGEGGWDYTNIPIDHTKMYRVSVWAKQLSFAGGIYLGCDMVNTNNLDNSSNNNPYFFAGLDLPTLNEWYLLVGYIYPSNSTITTAHELSGVYDRFGVKRVFSAPTYKNKPNVTTQTHRTYQYYSTTIGTEAQFYAPRFDLCDGNEESLSDIVHAPVAVDWVSDWSTGTTFLNGQKIITPRIFAGTNNGGLLTGIAMGKDVTGGTEDKIGIVGYKDGVKNFELKPDGSAIFGRSIGRQFIIYPDGSIATPNIDASTITSGLLKSANYVSNSAGMKIDLSNGSIDTKNFKVDSSGNATFSGDLSGANLKGTALNFGYDGKLQQNLSTGLVTFSGGLGGSGIVINGGTGGIVLKTGGIGYSWTQVEDFNVLGDSWFDGGMHVSGNAYFAGVYDAGSGRGFVQNGGNIAYLKFLEGGSNYLEITTANKQWGINAWESDIRLKENIIDSKVDALSNIMKIKHREFDFKTGSHLNIGYVAQELFEIDEDFVFGVMQEDGTEILNPKISTLIPYLSRAIQQLKEIVDVQAIEIEKLKGGLL